MDPELFGRIHPDPVITDQASMISLFLIFFKRTNLTILQKFVSNTFYQLDLISFFLKGNQIGEIFFYILQNFDHSLEVFCRSFKNILSMFHFTT